MSDSVEGEISYAILGILTTLDICFVTNYFVIKSLRKFADTKARSEPPDDDAEVATKNSSGGFVETFVFGLLLGRVKPLPLSIQKFPQWRRIPKNIHIWMTTVLVLISLALLSPQYFSDFLPLPDVTLNADLCKTEDIESGLAELQLQIEDITNYINATDQYNHMMRFHDALTNDTTRYGTREGTSSDKDYTCQTVADDNIDGDLSGVKSDWSSLTTDPYATYGPFFPGYCAAAQQFAIDAALRQQCDNEQCACPRVPSTGATRFFGVDGKELCFLRLCFTMPTACPGQTDDLEGNLKNYREAQLQAVAEDPEFQEFQADASDASTEAAAAVVTVLLYQFDVASNIYSVYICVALFFPTPLEVFRYPYIIAIKRLLFGVTQGWFILLFIAAWWGIEYFQSFLVSDDFLAFLQNLRAGDPCFLDGEYVAARQTLINDVCDGFVGQEPIFATSVTTLPTIFLEIEEFAKSTCNSCLFPMVDMFELNDDNYPLSMVEPWGFSSTVDNMCKRRSPECTVYVPDDDIEYIGNRTLCIDSEFSRELATQAPDADTDWKIILQLWVTSGLIASLLVKIAMSNFAIQLLKLADPFVVCAGEFLWIPAKLGNGLGGRSKHVVFKGFKQNKEKTLKNLALRSTIIWASIMHISLFNLLWSGYTAQSSSASSSGSAFTVSSEDASILSICVGVSAGFVVGALCIMKTLKIRARKYVPYDGEGQKLVEDEDYSVEDEDYSDEE